MIPSFLLTHMATLERKSGHGTFGPEHGPPVQVRCRVKLYRQVRVSVSHDEPSDRGTAMLRPDVQIDKGDRFTFGGETYTVLRVRDVYGPAGVEYREAVFG